MAFTIDCILSSGGSYKSSNPDLRGSVLKGCGTAKGIKLKQGQAISGSGIFKTEDVKMQSYFHPELIKPENRMLNDGEKAGFSGKKREN
ncbi:MAG: hypothetical protein ACFNKL_09550, partial [Treponema sp.]